METEKSPVAKAVRELRQVLGDSQQAFAFRMKVAVRTIARWETVRPPKDHVVIQVLAKQAFLQDRPDLGFALLSAPDIAEAAWVEHYRALPQGWRDAFATGQFMLNGQKGKEVRHAFDSFAAQINALYSELHPRSIPASNSRDPDDVDVREGAK